MIRHDAVACTTALRRLDRRPGARRRRHRLCRRRITGDRAARRSLERTTGSNGCPDWWSRDSPTPTRTCSTAGCAAAPTTRRHVLDLAGRHVPAGRPARPGQSLRALAFAVYLEMLCAGYTAVGEFHYLHHGAGGPAVRRAERDGTGDRGCGGRCGHRPDAARRRLPGRRFRRAGDRRAATLRGRRRGGLGGPGVRAAVGPAAGRRSARRRGGALGAGRAAAAAAGGGAGGAAADAVLHAHLSEQAAENDAAIAGDRSDADAAPRRRRRARPTDRAGARHPPHRVRRGISAGTAARW